VSVIQLNLVELCELAEVAVELLVPPDDVSDGGAAKEILLLESEFLALFSGVIGIEH
jgi:hypothetical protein